MESNNTKFDMIEKAILILLTIYFSGWWRHLLFSLIRKTLENQYLWKFLGKKTLCKHKKFLKKVQSYKQKYTKRIFWKNEWYPSNFEKACFPKVFFINENSMWRHQVKKWIAHKMRMAFSILFNFVSLEFILIGFSSSSKIWICEKRFQ